MPRYSVRMTKEIEVVCEVEAEDENEAEEIAFTAYADGLTVGNLDGLLSYHDADEPMFFDTDQLDGDEEE